MGYCVVSLVFVACGKEDGGPIVRVEAVRGAAARISMFVCPCQDVASWHLPRSDSHD
jgi:hypothetical protein